MWEHKEGQGAWRETPGQSEMWGNRETGDIEMGGMERDEGHGERRGAGQK